MRTVTVDFEPFQGTGSPTLYARVGANILFAGAAVVSFFTSTLGDPFAHFDSQPRWIFMTFSSFAVAAFNITAATAVWARFRKIADSDAEPGHEYSRYSQLKTLFVLSTILGAVLAGATAFLASLWKTATDENSGFIAPCLCGIFAFIIDIVAMVGDSLLFLQERKAFIQATSSEAELGEGEIII
ncbi:hypothetical protein H2200_000888 [Cladophialophora chaetospira]|uniref:Uncharacterized protein n=1 Tax=Cladophialophora chaetospira TaxID=386627 RepID=A0AA38XPD9_9EURO|nr:hypothetical protein H2200_000888 [Cladophialophora chaetospira]